MLTDKLEIKRLKALDVLKESADDRGGQVDAAERFDSDMALMTGELAKLLADVVAALGGAQIAQAA